jgi:hypothetical protein
MTGESYFPLKPFCIGIGAASRTSTVYLFIIAFDDDKRHSGCPRGRILHTFLVVKPSCSSFTAFTSAHCPPYHVGQQQNSDVPGLRASRSRGSSPNADTSPDLTRPKQALIRRQPPTRSAYTLYVRPWPTSRSPATRCRGQVQDIKAQRVRPSSTQAPSSQLPTSTPIHFSSKPPRCVSVHVSEHHQRRLTVHPPNPQ